jgi:sugar O-acyltransferase (sialic acid O-acetyltransferase NeuD family)
VSDLRDNIIVVGASGHAKVVIDIVERQGLYRIAFLVDDDLSMEGVTIFGYEVRGDRNVLTADRGRDGIRLTIVAIGDNRIRSELARFAKYSRLELVSALHPSAQIGRNVSVGEGSVVMAGAIVNPESTLGANCIVNTAASVDHDCTLGESVHVAPGVAICGGVTIGDRTFVGAGATVIPGVKIGKDVIVGAGATVVRDVPDVP